MARMRYKPEEIVGLLTAGGGAAWPGHVDGGRDPAAGDQRGHLLQVAQGVRRDERRPAPPPQRRLRRRTSGCAGLSRI